MSDLNFQTDGAQRFRCALSLSGVHSVLEALSQLPDDQPGLRLAHLPALQPILSGAGSMADIAAACIGKGALPVRAVLFDKNAAVNWGLPWHQDRTIVVRRRIETAGYGPWSMKSGLIHVAPPFHILEAMVTLRLHLDPVDEDNAPLLVAPGSHRAGKVTEADIPASVARFGSVSCLAESGDVWAYSTPILHASRPAARPRRRRVLQVDYANRTLDNGLEWLGA